MHEQDPNSDVGEPCRECGEYAIPCECGRPIETVAQLQRALDAAGVVDAVAYKSAGGWAVSLTGEWRKFACCSADTLGQAFAGALEAWWEQES